MRISDWSSDVCSSDLFRGAIALGAAGGDRPVVQLRGDVVQFALVVLPHRAVGQPGLAQALREALRKLVRQHGLQLRGGPRLPLFAQECLGVERRQQIQPQRVAGLPRSEEHTSELQSLMRISYAVFCLKKKKQTKQNTQMNTNA